MNDVDKNHVPIPMEVIEKKMEAALIEQEHRLAAVFLNYWRSRDYDRSDPRRAAAVKAILWKIFSPGTAAAGGVALLTIFGTLIALHANYLLIKQNQKIDQQSFLIEAQRRAGLVTEFTSILEQIEKERDSNKKQLHKMKLSQATVGRVVALSRSYRPYRYLEIEGDADGSLVISDINPSTNTDEYNSSFLLSFRNALLGESEDLSNSKTPTLTKEALSPERGQLLITLVNSNIDLTEVISSFADFSRSDLRNAVFTKNKLDNIRLNGSNLSDSDLLDSSLISSFL